MSCLQKHFGRILRNSSYVVRAFDAKETINIDTNHIVNKLYDFNPKTNTVIRRNIDAYIVLLFLPGSYTDSHILELHCMLHIEMKMIAGLEGRLDSFEK